MSIALTIVGILMAALVVTAVLGFFWAGKTGQLHNLEEGAKVIFDEDEPIGKPTDLVFSAKKKKEKPGNAGESDAVKKPDDSRQF